jgi:hypothetical protein
MQALRPGSPVFFGPEIHFADLMPVTVRLYLLDTASMGFGYDLVDIRWKHELNDRFRSWRNNDVHDRRGARGEHKFLQQPSSTLNLAEQQVKECRKCGDQNQKADVVLEVYAHGRTAQVIHTEIDPAAMAVILSIVEVSARIRLDPPGRNTGAARLTPVKFVLLTAAFMSNGTDTHEVSAPVFPTVAVSVVVPVKAVVVLTTHDAMNAFVGNAMRVTLCVTAAAFATVALVPVG